jgi:biopolymer transport protein ExbB
MTLFRIGMICGCATLAVAQEANEKTGAAIGAAAATAMQARVEASNQRLAELRQAIAAEKVPLNRALTEAEQALSDLRREYDAVKRQADSSALESATLRNEIKQRETERNYLSSLINEYARSFETRLHISELEQYRDPLAAARGAQERLADDPAAAFGDQLCLILMSLARLEEMAGGLTFDGTAAGDDGLVKRGKFLLFGPVAYFASTDAKLVGVASQRVGSLFPVVEPYADAAQTEQVRQVLADGRGQLPFDASLGNARKIEELKESIVEHFLKGGAVMWPILLLLCCAMLVVLLKWLSLLFVRLPRPKRFAELLDAVRQKDIVRAKALVSEIRGLAGRMLTAGVEVLDQPRELIEEAMFEKMLDAKASLHRFIPFVAVAAACAPLLGLLGTVTGIISTFNLMTVFGSGDIKMLSSGISEALITTEYGLYVAIPCVLMHSFLSRKAKGITDKMEQIAVKFMCEVGKI